MVPSHSSPGCSYCFLQSSRGGCRRHREGGVEGDTEEVAGGAHPPPRPSAVTHSELKQTEWRLLLLLLLCSRPVLIGTAHSRTITAAVPGRLFTRCPLPGSCTVSALLGEGLSMGLSAIPDEACPSQMEQSGDQGRARVQPAPCWSSG